ncbi:hypothetical protein K438DRAFT_1944961 [Mycena galopus ATCC 62051]|nr:hypothetical protein K438DRAFT_1944961 [Mycena galopus ATCC 62051]
MNKTLSQCCTASERRKNRIWGSARGATRSRSAVHGQPPAHAELARERAVAGELLREISRKVAKLWAEVEARQTRQVQHSAGEGGDGRVQPKVNSKAEVRVKG